MNLITLDYSEFDQLAFWLFQNGGPTIRYRTARELMRNRENVDFDLLEKELAGSPEVKTWLQHLNPEQVNEHNYHGSFNTCFENAMNKLAQLGMYADIPALDAITFPLRQWFTRMVNQGKEQWEIFPMIVFASTFAMAGYRDAAIMTFLKERLETVYQFIRQGDFHIYDDREKYKGIPAAFREKPIIKPELYPRGNYRLPLIYDLYGFTALLETKEPELLQKIPTVVSYILHPDYHQLADGYGVLAVSRGRYHALGWDAKLPGFHGIDDAAVKSGARMLQRAVLMSHFPEATNHPWFQGMLNHLESFRTERGNYLFPKHYLTEKEGYWISGMHMGLGENRKSKIALELESTFWMLKLKSLIAQSKGLPQ